MGGRGSSSGISQNGNMYGSQYKTVLEYGNVKFVTNKVKNYEPLMETMTRGRMYVQVGGNDLLRIIFMDNKNKRTKVIEYDKKRKNWHIHYGNEHNEQSQSSHNPLLKQDKLILEKITKIWHNHRK